MRKVDNEHLVKLEEYMNKYNYRLDDILFSARMEVSDIIYEEHKMGCYIVDAVIIGMQLLLVIIGVVCALFGLRVSAITCSMTLILLTLVLVNNAIHDYAWRKAKKRLDELDGIIEKLNNDTNEQKSDIIY